MRKFKKTISLFIVTVFMLSNFSCLVFGNEPSKFENVSNGVNLFYS